MRSVPTAFTSLVRPIMDDHATSLPLVFLDAVPMCDCGFLHCRRFGENQRVFCTHARTCLSMVRAKSGGEETPAPMLFKKPSRSFLTAVQKIANLSPHFRTPHVACMWGVGASTPRYPPRSRVQEGGVECRQCTTRGGMLGHTFMLAEPCEVRSTLYESWGLRV
jgi:hypothetical protein